MIDKCYMRQVVVFYQNDKEGAVERVRLCQNIEQMLKQSLLCYSFMGIYFIIEDNGVSLNLVIPGVYQRADLFWKGS